MLGLAGACIQRSGDNVHDSFSPGRDRMAHGARRGTPGIDEKSS